jgi:hypothetical protein
MDRDTAAKIVDKSRQQLVDQGIIAQDFVSATEIYVEKHNSVTQCVFRFKNQKRKVD